MAQGVQRTHTGMEGRCGRIMQTSTRRVKTQRVVITFLRVVVIIQSQRIFTVRRSLHGICYSNSVRPSVRLSVTLVDCVHMVRPTIMI